MQAGSEPKGERKAWVKENNWSQDQQGIARAPRTHSVMRTAHEIDEKSSYKEHRVDALAPYAEEGRGKLRKATGSRKQAPIR